MNGVSQDGGGGRWGGGGGGGEGNAFHALRGLNK